MGKQLVEAGRWEDIYTDALAMYCMAHAQYCRALEMLRGPVGQCPNCDPDREKERPVDWMPCRPPRHLAVAYGEVIKNRHGDAVRSPYMAQKKEAEAQMIRLEGEFGLTPASHSRLPGGRTKQQSPRQSFSPTTATPDNDPRKLLEMQVMAGKS